MLRGAQFSLSAIMLVTLAAAILMRWPITWLIALAAETFAVLLCVEYLIRKIPIGIRSIMLSNRRRMDGSRSISRERAENQAIRKLRWNLLALFLIALLPLNLMVWVATLDQRWLSSSPIQTQVVPVAEVVPDESESIELSKVRDEYKVIAITVAFGWFVFGCWLIKSGYLYSLNELLKATKLRAREYQLQDLTLAGDNLDQKHSIRGPTKHSKHAARMTY